MDVRKRKSFANLPQHEKDLINQAMTEEVEKQINHNMAELQKVWLQYACIILNKYFGFGEKRCMLFISNWRDIYKMNAKITCKEDQTEYIKSELDKIFHGDYPTLFIDKMEEIT